MSQYSLLGRFKDPLEQQAVKLLMDRIAQLEAQAGGIGGVTQPLAAALDANRQRLTAVADPTAPADAVTLQYLKKYVEGAIALATTPAATTTVPPPTIPPPVIPPGDPIPTICYNSLLLGQPAGVPASPNLRWFRGDFCGVNVSGLPAVAGGATDPSLVLTPFIDRYSAANQALIFAAHHARGYTHWKLWWPDSRDGAGQSEDQFVATCQLVQANGFYPVPFLYAKGYDGVNPSITKNDSLIAKLIAGGVAQIACVGGELDLFNTPGPTIQALIDHVTAQLVPAGCNVYVHFSEGYVAWQAPGDLGSAFWNANVGKLTGILHQKALAWDCAMYQARLADLQVRFGTGVAFWPADSGFGHPFDIVADEYSGTPRFNGSMSEATAQTIGRNAICSPNQGGGPAPIPIMGFNNAGPNV